MELDQREAIQYQRLLAQSGTVLAAVMVVLVGSFTLGIEPSLLTLPGPGASMATSGLGPAEYLEEVECPTLVFFMGLFIMVGEAPQSQ